MANPKATSSTATSPRPIIEENASKIQRFGLPEGLPGGLPAVLEDVMRVKSFAMVMHLDYKRRQNCVARWHVCGFCLCNGREATILLL